MTKMDDFKYRKFIYYYTILLAISCIFLAHVSNAFHHWMIALLIAFGFAYKSYRIRRSMLMEGFFLSIFIFIIWALLSINWAVSHDEIINRVLVYTYSLMIVFVTYILFDNGKYIELFFNASAVSAFLLSLYIIYYSGYNVLSMNRFGNDAMSINTAATKFAYVALVQFALFFEKKRIINLIAFGYFALIIILTGSKTAFLMLLIGSMVFYLKRYTLRGGTIFKIKGLLVVVIAVLLIFAMITYVPVFYQIFGRRIDQFIQIILGKVSYELSHSTSVRIGLVQEAWKGFLKRPIIGWGENNMIYYSQYNMHAHSSLMEILFDLGAIGFLSYFARYFIVFRTLQFTKRKSIYSVLSSSIMIASVIESATSISHNDLLSWLMLLFAYMYALMNLKI